MVKFNSEEILKCLCFVILGYFVVMIFDRMCSCNNKFSIGSPIEGCNPTCKKNNASSCNQCTEYQGGGPLGGQRREYRCELESTCRYGAQVGYTADVEEPMNDPFQEPECSEIEDVSNCSEHHPACEGCYIKSDYGDGDAYYECKNMQTCKKSNISRAAPA